jgi:hypothetical protein
MDEFKVYDFNGTGTNAGTIQIAAGGDEADSSEYLADSTNDYTFYFAPVDSSNRGEYLFIKSDSQFSGINVDLDTNGATGGTLNLDWEYWNGSSWASLEAVTGFTDTTNNLTTDGSIYWNTTPSGWSPYSNHGGHEFYYIRTSLNNTSGTYTTSPVENLIRTDILNFRLESDLSSNDRTLAIPGSSTQNATEPVGIWHMDEAQGTTVSDSSVRQNNLTLSGATWEKAAGNPLSNRSAHLKFDGSNDLLSRSNDPDFDFDTGSFTITGWFRHASAISGTDMLISRHETGGWKVYMNSSGFLCFAIDADSTWTPAEEVCSTASYADSTWHSFTAVKTGTSNFAIYVDGIKRGEDTSVSTTDSLNSSSTLYIGIDTNGTSNPWDGFMDEIAIYNYARSASEILANHADQSAALFGSDTDDPLQNGLVAYW